MNPQRVVQKYGETMKQTAKAVYISCDTDIQRSALFRVKTVRDLVTQQKAAAKRAPDENLANYLLSLYCILESRSYEIQASMLLKSDQAEKAWEALIAAQDWAVSAVRADKRQLEWGAETAERLERAEKTLFPTQTFVSGAYVYSGTTCTICGKDYESDDCMHIVGRPYNGEFCQRIVKEIVGVNHVAIVKNPTSKTHRITEIEGRNAITGAATARTSDMVDASARLV